jgi:hypothetical protein
VKQPDERVARQRSVADIEKMAQADAKRQRKRRKRLARIRHKRTR